MTRASRKCYNLTNIISQCASPTYWCIGVARGTQRTCILPDSQQILHLGFKEPKWAASHVARQQPPSVPLKLFSYVPSSPKTRQLSSIIHSPPDRSKNTHHLHFSTTNPIQNLPRTYSMYIDGSVSNHILESQIWKIQKPDSRSTDFEHRIERNSKSMKWWKVKT